MFAAVWINKFAHAQRHREPLAESLKNLVNDSKESVHWEPVLNKNRFSIPIPRSLRTLTFKIESVHPSVQPNYVANSLKVLLRYHVHKNAKESWTQGLRPLAVAGIKWAPDGKT